LAQPAPRRPDLRPARGVPGPGGLQRPGDLGPGAPGLGRERALAAAGTGAGQANTGRTGGLRPAPMLITDPRWAPWSLDTDNYLLVKLDDSGSDLRVDLEQCLDPA